MSKKFKKIKRQNSVKGQIKHGHIIDPLVATSLSVMCVCACIYVSIYVDIHSKNIYILNKKAT